MPSRAALCFTRGSVLAVRTATRASSSARARRLRPPTAALRLCCLLAGQPLCHHERPEAAFLWRVRHHRRRMRPADGRWSHRRRRQHRNANVLCRSTAPKTRARQPGFRVPMKCLDVEGALGRALDNCSQAAPAFILCFGIAAFGSLETRAARRSCACNRADIRALQ